MRIWIGQGLQNSESCPRRPYIPAVKIGSMGLGSSPLVCIYGPYVWAVSHLLVKFVAAAGMGLHVDSNHCYLHRIQSSKFICFLSNGECSLSWVTLPYLTHWYSSHLSECLHPYVFCILWSYSFANLHRSPFRSMLVYIAAPVVWNSFFFYSSFISNSKYTLSKKQPHWCCWWTGVTEKWLVEK